MASSAANRLSRQHRSRLALLSATVTSGVVNLAMGADPTDIDTWYLSAADGLLDRVLSGYGTARRMSTDYLRRHSVLERHPVNPVPASLNMARARTALRVTGPVAFKSAVAAGQSEAQAVSTMASRMSGAASRLVLDGDRDTFEATLRSGQGIIGYRRVLGGPGCGFCAMLASRGAVYLSEASASRTKDGLRFHDHCRCSPMPLYTHEDEPSEVRFMQRLWNSATRGHTGEGKARAWRRSWEARQRAIRGAEPGGAVRVPALDRPAAVATDPALKMTLAELKAIVRAHAAKVKVPLSLFGTKKADIVRNLRSWESTYTVKIAGLPEWKPPPAPRPGFENVPPLAKPDMSRPPLTGAALNDWADYFVHDQRSGRHEWVNAKGDTPAEGVRVSGLRAHRPMLSGPFAHPGYTVQTGTAWRFDGVSYLIEHGPNDFGAPWVSRALMELRDAHKAIPAAQQVNRSYAILLGRSPDDAYWQAKYRNPSHRAAMSAGGGDTAIWGFTPNISRVDVDSLRHETGHSLDYAVGRLAAGSESPDWHLAADRDMPHAASISNLQSTHWQAKELAQFDPSRAYAKGVTTYGRSSPAEDWAESVMLYQLGPIATGRLPGVTIPKTPAMPSGATAITNAEILYFRDIYPARAAILDKLFPDIARAQKAEIAALRTPAREGMSPTQFDAQLGIARKGNAATASTVYRFTGNANQNADLFPDRAERVAIMDAFAGYRGIGSRRTNAQLRGGGAVGPRVEQMDKAFAVSPLKDDVLVYRGARGTLEFGARGSWGADLTGRVWTDRAYTSTSANVAKAEPFAKDGVLMRIIVPRDTPAVGIRPASRIEAREQEILLARGQSFRVVRDNGTDAQGRRLLDVEVVPPVGRRSTTNIASMTVTQLRAQAKAQGVKGYSRMVKADLIAALGGKAPAKKAAKAKRTPVQSAREKRRLELLATVDRGGYPGRGLRDVEDLGALESAGLIEKHAGSPHGWRLTDRGRGRL